VTLTCPRYVQKVRVKLCKCLGENGRHEETRTPDLYRVNFEVPTLKPFPYLAFPHLIGLKTPYKSPSFDGELMASFSEIYRASESNECYRDFAKTILIFVPQVTHQQRVVSCHGIENPAIGRRVTFASAARLTVPALPTPVRPE